MISLLGNQSLVLKEQILFGGPAISGRPVALRPDLAIGLPFSDNPFRVPRGVRMNLVLCSPSTRRIGHFPPEVKREKEKNSFLSPPFASNRMCIDQT